MDVSAPFLLIGNPESRRVALFQAALCRLGLPLAAVISWQDLLLGRRALSDSLPPEAILRIESPDRDFAVERALLAEGAACSEPEGCACLSRVEIDALPFEKGRILAPRQWYLGLRSALHRITQQLEARPDCRVMNAPAEIALMFDKVACGEHLARHAVPTPRPLGVLASYDDLLTRMKAAGCHQAFVKLAHGSSASGAVAYRTNGRRHQALSTVEMVESAGGLRLYNSRQIQVYEDARR